MKLFGQKGANSQIRGSLTDGFQIDSSDTVKTLTGGTAGEKDSLAEVPSLLSSADESDKESYNGILSDKDGENSDSAEELSVKFTKGSIVNRPAFVLLNTDPSFDPEDDNFLEEEEEKGRDNEISDFVTGNISSLRTGTYGGSTGSFAASNESDADEPSAEQKTKNTVIVIRPELSGSDSHSNLPEGDYYRGRNSLPKLIPSLCLEFNNHLWVYVSAVVLCILSLIKVSQVQDTREMTSHLNEINQSNIGLRNEWLRLQSEKQKLSEHAAVRSYATTQLRMESPKIENEYVISIH